MSEITSQYLTIHLVSKLEQRPAVGVTYVIANIPAANEELVKKWIDNDPAYYVERHNVKYDTSPVINL